MTSKKYRRDTCFRDITKKTTFRKWAEDVRSALQVLFMDVEADGMLDAIVDETKLDTVVDNCDCVDSIGVTLKMDGEL